MHELRFSAELLAYLALLLGLGGLAGRVAGRPSSFFEQLTLGYGAALAFAFLAAACGLLGPGGAIVGALLGLTGLVLSRGELRRAAAPPRFSRADLLPALMVAAVLLPSFWIALNPAVNWDAAVYHLTLPRIYLEAGGFTPVEMSVYAIWPHGPQLIYAFGLLAGGPPLAKLMHFAAALLVLAGLHHALRRSGLEYWRGGAWVAIAALVVHPLVLFEMQTAYVDLTQAFLFLAAFLALARAGEKPEDAGRALLLAGIAGGGIAVCKPTGLLLLPALLPLLFPYLLARRREGKTGEALLLLATRWLAPILLFWLPWVFRSFKLTGNPFYPFFWTRLGGPDWNEDLARQFVEWQQGIGMGRRPLDYLLLPWRLLTQGEHGFDRFDGRLSLALLPLLLLALFRAARPDPPRLLRPALAAAAIQLALWAFSSQQLRFLIPALPLVALAVGLAAADLAARWPRLGRIGPVFAALLPAVVFSEDPALLRKGLQHAAIYRDPGFVDDPWGAAPAYRERLLELPADVKILLLGSNQGYYVPRPFVADSFFEASQVAAWLADTPREELPAKLAARGITHVLVRLPLRGPYPRPLFELLSEGRQLRPIWSSPGGDAVLLELAR